MLLSGARRRRAGEAPGSMYGRAHPPFRRDSGDEYEGAAGSGGGGSGTDSTDEAAAPGQQQPGGSGGLGGTRRPARAPGQLFRPATLPYVDRRRPTPSEKARREERDRRARTIGPGVVVYGYEPPGAEPVEDPVDDWIIKPRENSARAKLQRRRKYEPYVGTLEADRLRRLDEHLVRRACTYDDYDDDEDDIDDLDDEFDEEGYDPERGGGGRGFYDVEEDEEEPRWRDDRARRAKSKVRKRESP